MRKIKLSPRQTTIIAIALIAFGILSRLAPHPPNFAPIAAIALFGAAVLPARLAVWLPLTAMIISDLLIGTHSLIVWTWGAFVAISLFGSFVLRKKVSPFAVVGSSLIASVFFFVVTNFGVWLDGTLYPATFSGLVDAYVKALPFFRNTVLGDLAYSGILFGAYYAAVDYGSKIQAWRLQKHF